MVDANRFKSINDNYVHLEGDHALKEIGEMLENTAAEFNGFTARTGGDVFVLIFTSQNIDDPEKVIAFANQTLADLRQRDQIPYELSVSIGYVATSDKNVSVRQAYHASMEKN